VLAATHRDLESAMKERQFREDLFYRLSGVTITLPPLVQRTEDIPDLVKYFMHRSGPELGSSLLPFSRKPSTFLQSQVWPGNVRELEKPPTCCRAKRRCAVCPTLPRSRRWPRSRLTTFAGCCLPCSG
jgi:transcriptional regulator with GAF, ATPase, and Fis domain